MMKAYMTAHIISLILGILLDLAAGDPHGLPHPIRAVGALISALEKRLLGDASEGGRRSAASEKRRGALLWSAVVAAVFATASAVLAGAYLINIYLGIIAESVLTAYILAARSLAGESMAVGKRLDADDHAGAAAALSMIVGRDTDCLDDEEIIKAAVETVAENASDGVVAPLIYTAVGGPILGMIYKAVNTMDSMLGYRNSRYINFGAFAARADDAANYLPSRISALFMIAASAVLSVFSKDYDARAAFRIWKRDRRCHTSPNSAQTESVCAGALGLRLGGPHRYSGVMVDKPFIGDETRKPEAADIRRACALMFGTEALVAIVLVALLPLL